MVSSGGAVHVGEPANAFLGNHFLFFPFFFFLLFLLFLCFLLLLFKGSFLFFYLFHRFLLNSRKLQAIPCVY
ncbi:hypothetical protein FOA19_23130 [Rufibacter hautae]|uniref:Uncharacterized protein n=1 Tax=Rufibacter hautae TaxID=2595005 RepID=A0A5B6T8W6_9BACT|nr:hypothetical protein FOA19_23130 [Rufibacter hautae]